MKTILIGSQRYNPIPYIIDIIDNQIKSYDQKRLIRLYFLDHRVDTRMGITNYIVEDNTNTDFDVTYKVSNCTLTILSELVEDMTDEAKYSDRRSIILLYFNLDSIDHSIINSILNSIQQVMDIMTLDLICSSTSKFVESDILNRFNSIYICRNDTSSSDDEIVKYLIETDVWCGADRLRRLIMTLDEKSIDTIGIKDLQKIMDSDVSSYGRILVAQ
jgi:hypothetical protein